MVKQAVNVVTDLCMRPSRQKKMEECLIRRFFSTTDHKFLLWNALSVSCKVLPRLKMYKYCENIGFWREQRNKLRASQISRQNKKVL